MRLQYTGNGKHVTGVPMTDLEADEITRLAGVFNISEEELIDQLTARGVYALPKAKSKKSDSQSEEEQS